MERKRLFFRTLLEQYGEEAYEICNSEFYREEKCPVCSKSIYSYSEWHETGYEIEKCTNGCWEHESYGLEYRLTVGTEHFRGKYDKDFLKMFDKLLAKKRKKYKRNRYFFWKKKKSQRRKC